MDGRVNGWVGGLGRWVLRCESFCSTYPLTQGKEARSIGAPSNYTWGCIDGWVSAWVDGWMDGWMGGWTNGWMNECMDGWVGEWMGG